jgi:hypothetical protein
MDVIDEIKIPSSGGRRTFVCNRHKLDFCTECLADFGLLNQLRYDSEGSHSNNATEYLSSAIDDYYQRNSGRMAPGMIASPRLIPLIEEMQGSATSSLGEMIECLSYFTFTCHGAPHMRDRMVSILKVTLDSLQSSDAAEQKEPFDLADVKKQQKKDKALRRAKGEPEGPKQKYEKIFETIMSSVTKITAALGKAQITERGTFFQDFEKAVAALAKTQESEAIVSAAAASMRFGNDGRAGISQEFRQAMENMSVWHTFVLAHSEGGTRYDDPVNWLAAEIVTLLNRHGMKLDPFPKREILNEIARGLVNFRLACGALIENMPEEHQFQALGAEAMGTADDRDRAVIADMYAPAKLAEFMAEPQIGTGFHLKEVSTWRVPDVDNIFALNRRQHSVQFHHNSFHQVLELVENVAETWDRIQKNPDQDVVEKFDANEGTEDSKNLAIRPIELWWFTPPGDASDTKVPLLGVEYMFASKRSAGPDSILKFSQGLQKGTLFHRNTCNDETMDLFISLLEENRVQLAQDDPTFRAYKKRIPKGWRFSVIRPVDPNKRSGVRLCPQCGKPATKTCSRCRIVAYCSRDCQSAQWKKHKSACKTVTK